MASKHDFLDTLRPHGRLARRARSFKEDFLVKINQMRSPSGNRTLSPSKGIKKGHKARLNNSPGLKTNSPEKDINSVQHSLKLLKHALGYLKDVVQKNTLEMLPGSASVVLETVLNIHTDLKKCLANEDEGSKAVLTTEQVYQNMADLLQWADMVQLYPDKPIDKEQVDEKLDKLQDSIQNLVDLCVEIHKNRNSPVFQVNGHSTPKSENVHRNSLLDIPLTPHERQILERTSFEPPHLPHSTSSDSILNNTPPPKPPLPALRTLAGFNGLEPIPPLPPKKRTAFFHFSQQLGNGSPFPDWRSHSPECGTPLSKSSASSLDSSLNHSADDLLSISRSYHYSSFSSSAFHQSSMDSVDELEPPALPLKQRQRTPSQYDNIPEHSATCPRATQFSSHHLSWSHEPSCPHHSLADSKPPPLPPKQKNGVMAYMQMFGSYSEPSEGEFYRHSVHAYQVFQSQWTHTVNSNLVSNADDSSFFLEQPSLESTAIPPALPPKKNKPNILKSSSSTTIDPLPNPVNEERSASEDAFVEQSPIDELDVTHHLTLKNPEEEGPSIKGGSIEALIVQATRASKNEFLYQEAFLTTYRTFISPLELVQKLLYRYNRFIQMSELRQRAARNAFALLVRVVDDLSACDLKEEVVQLLVEFSYALVRRGDLVLAKALRKVILERWEYKQLHKLSALPVLLPSVAVSTHQAALTHFKAEHLAEQMTLLDAFLFQKIEIPEVLLWAKEQKEELSPNLTTFTEHFNKMSYWARSRILEQEEAKERERFVLKFIKIMKHLRKLNNFNSYLAILSALDSAPIRRLDWTRNITEDLKDFCALIDSSSSFRAYRQAIADTVSPCIPYIGLILQDLTFVHIGNTDLLPEGQINFSKRWQQFNILENIRRFKNSQYPFKRHEQIMYYFNNFDNYLCEESMWQISETIKPRGGGAKK